MFSNEKLKKLIQRLLQNATVKIYVDDKFQGSGFFISPDGYILTAYHCIGKYPPEIVIETNFKLRFKAQLEETKCLKHFDLDIAVLKVHFDNHDYVPLGRISPQCLDDNIVAIGYFAIENQPNIKIFDGKINGITNDKFETNAIKGKGQSGGLVYHYETKRVIGLVSGGHPANIIKDTGGAARFDRLFEKWPELEDINHKVAQSWDKRIKPDDIENPKIRLLDIKQGLSHKLSDILPIWNSVNAYLRNLEKVGINDADEDTLEVIESFGADNISAKEFIQFWQQSSSTTSKDTLTPNYKALADRLQHGEIVLFLGSDLHNNLAPQLAEYASYEANCSFPEICEYIELNDIDYGRDSLCRTVQKFVEPISPQPLINSLHKLLVKLPSPIILIYSGYDTLLEKMYQQYNKKFVVLSHSHNPQEIGWTFIRYSDKSEHEAYLAEGLSSLEPLEQGYSLIYKINGCLSLNQKDSLMLSEQDYFQFAKYVDKLIPDYLIKQIRSRSFWFLGQYPQTWDSRLIMQTILDKRNNKHAVAVHKDADQFASVYWKSKGVDNYRIDLAEFVASLEEYL